VKEDKANGLRKDSSFYHNGYWEVFDFDDSGKETRFRAASGIKSIRRYDDGKHLKEHYRMDEKGDTLKSEQYEWKNGRLVRMTANGVVRNYIYGKTLQDTVRVEPSDEGFNYHRGYNGTAGQIPEEGTPKYKFFARNPYGHIYFDNENNKSLINNLTAKNSVSENSEQLKFLGKRTANLCVEKDSDMFNVYTQCIRYKRNDIPQNAPNNGLYGHSDAKLFLNFECGCTVGGKYQPLFAIETANEKIEIMESVWRYYYEYKDWYERCWADAYLQDTYKHESQHIRNARDFVKFLKTSVKIINSNTKTECDIEAEKEFGVLDVKWDEWYGWEQEHANGKINKYPRSPEPGGTRYELLCS